MRFSAALFLAGISVAAVVPRLTFDQLVDTSERVVQGRVQRTWVAWDRARHFIWTHYEVAVSDTVKGAASPTVVVSEPGGTLDGITMTIPGVVHYSRGDDMVLFLRRTPLGYLRTNGYTQGRYRVRDRMQAARLKDRVRSRLR